MSHPIWTAGPRVRVDSLRRGEWFLDINGSVWRYERPHGTGVGVRHVVAPSGERSCFAGCAEVVPWVLQRPLFE